MSVLRLHLTKDIGQSDRSTDTKFQRLHLSIQPLSAEQLLNARAALKADNCQVKERLGLPLEHLESSPLFARIACYLDLPNVLACAL